MDKSFLMELLNAHGVSGSEMEIEQKIYAHMLPIADSVTVDELGNVTAAVNPEAPFRVLLAGHADEIGLMVSAVTSEGYLKAAAIGGVYPTTYPGHKVRIHTEQGTVYGAVVNTRELSEKKELKVEDLTIDIGAVSREDALKHVALGDTVTFDTDVRELLNDRITARAMDDRVGAWVVMEALRLAKEQGVSVGVYSTATAGEETSGNGAYFAASRIRPRIAIAVDVTYTNDYPGVDGASTGDVSVGKGPVICCSPSVHKKLNRLLYRAAEEAGIAVQTEACGGRTCTDGDTVHLTGLGVPFALVSIPLRYMHCPDEVGSLRDIQACAELLARFLCNCTETMDLRPF